MEKKRLKIAIALMVGIIILTLSACDRGNEPIEYYSQSSPGIYAGEDVLEVNEKLIARYGKKFKYEKESSSGSLSYDGHKSGTYTVSFLVENKDMYDVYIEKKENTAWFPLGIICTSAKYVCNEIPFYFVGYEVLDGINGKMMINGKMKPVRVGFYSGATFTVGVGSNNLADSNIKDFLAGEADFDVDTFTYKLTEKEKKKLGTECGMLTFRQVEDDKGTGAAERYLKSNRKVRARHGNGYIPVQSKCIYYQGGVVDGSLDERAAWEYKIDNEKYILYLYKEENKAWEVTGCLCTSTRYISDDGKIELNKFNEYYTDGEIEIKGKKKKITGRLSSRFDFSKEMEMTIRFVDDRVKVNGQHNFLFDCIYDVDEIYAKFRNADGQKALEPYIEVPVHFKEVR